MPRQSPPSQRARNLMINASTQLMRHVVADLPADMPVTHPGCFIELSEITAQEKRGSISASNGNVRRTRVWYRFAATARRVVTLGAIAVEALKCLRKEALADGMEPPEIQLVLPGTLHRSSNFDWNVWHPLPEAAGISDDFSDVEYPFPWGRTGIFSFRSSPHGLLPS